MKQRKFAGYVPEAKIYTLLNTIDLIAQMPTIGKLEETMSNSQNTYYSFLSHPKYRIVYRYTDTEIYIVAICSTQMNNNI